MSTRAWISGVMSNSSIGNKQGLRVKFFDEDWEPAQHQVIIPSDKVMEASRRHTQGFALRREDFPEAVAVFDEKQFKKVRDLFCPGPFYAVKGKLAGIMSRFDLGDGGLIPFDVCRSDLRTKIDEKFYFLNFGARKNSFMPEESASTVKPLVFDKKLGLQLWEVKSWVEDGDVALSEASLSGADIWFEEAIWHKIFLSEKIVEALREEKVTIDFRLHECRIVKGS